MNNQTKYKTIGLMSGTSLDGLDIAFCEFEFVDGKWAFEIIYGETIPYSDEWKNRLQNAPNIPSKELIKLDLEYGHYLGEQTALFIDKYKLKPDLVASHGHTVFHKPEKRYTLQIGNGEALRTQINCPLVFDFRTQDVIMGGEGAPLVPIGDALLFNEFDACINIGGFANISMEKDGQRLAWDICPANIMMNPIAEKLGNAYDKNGDWAREGRISHALLEELNNLVFYKEKAPKSLGKEWVEEKINPLIQKYTISDKDFLCTLLEHISIQIARDLEGVEGKIIFTGGGVFNQFLMEQIQKKIEASIVIPDSQIIDFKEALIFAFMAVLRIRGEINILASVTGVPKNHSSGRILE
ncbi:MAG: anhydro-N-acetylmuramic acid kinase [Bacteroidetes bacterium]|nr:MAG: anhydro-N-acetylmuramic acid kinase [Bacteroidota bacterium]